MVSVSVAVLLSTMVCLDLFAREPAVMLWDTAGALANRVLKFWSVAGVFGALVPVNLHTDRVSSCLGALRVARWSRSTFLADRS